MSLRIGLDLDNTLIRYDEAFRAAAVKRGLIAAGFKGNKQKICDYVRGLEEGETRWQALQGHVYGAGIAGAELFGGVRAFLERAQRDDAVLCIVSHKTPFGHFDTERVNLHDAARGFLKQQGVFAFLPEDHVFFCADRAEKINRISSLSLDIFIDDLREVLIDPAFPRGVRKILFTGGQADKVENLESCANWRQIEKSIFDAERRAG